jgi:hypothetical protein
VHRNAPLTVEGRRRLCQRIASGWPISAAAEASNVSRQTASKWWHRWLDEGDAGLEDRPSRPGRCPHQTPRRVEKRIVGLRRRRKLGPARIASIVGVPRSTAHRVLVRHGLNRLAWMDRPTGRVVRRIHTDRPGELVHVDVKKQAVIPAGGGHRALGREARTGSIAKKGQGLPGDPLRRRRPHPPRLQRDPRRMSSDHRDELAELRRELRVTGEFAVFPE